MRIIGGSQKGRKFSPPKKLPVRPTTDFAKEGLFNVLQNHLDFENLSVLDLCAGTGNMSFEFASRGAQKVVAVDQHFGCIKYIKNIAKELEFSSLTAYKAELIRFLKKPSKQTPFDLIFADPPYGMEGTEKLADLVFESNLLVSNGLFVLEHNRDFTFNDHPLFLLSRKYGNVNFTFFQATHT
ncbi:MAG: 16S rRNA (guanine(966)-N(2))-methyltransferase RsmD [Vicingaceae bacterium]